MKFVFENSHEIHFKYYQKYNYYPTDYPFSAVQHERAPRNYSKKPSYFPDLSAVTIGAAAAAAAANSASPFGTSSLSSVRPLPLGSVHL